jgi:hypothetical protein
MARLAHVQYDVANARDRPGGVDDRNQFLDLAGILASPPKVAQVPCGATAHADRAVA